MNPFDGMLEIVNNEMLYRGVYVSPVLRPDLAEAGALCGGRRVCAIGALWLAAGVPIDNGHLPGVSPGRERDAFLRRPKNADLAAAYAALNEAAKEYIDANITAEDWMGFDCGRGYMEELFEGLFTLTYDEIRGIILRAKELYDPR